MILKADEREKRKYYYRRSHSGKHFQNSGSIFDIYWNFNFFCLQNHFYPFEQFYHCSLNILTLCS